MSGLPSDWGERIAAAENPFHVAISRYARAPVAFVREVLRVEPDQWQLQALQALARGHTRVAIRSEFGSGISPLVTIAGPRGARAICRRQSDTPWPQ